QDVDTHPQRRRRERLLLRVKRRTRVQQRDGNQRRRQSADHEGSLRLPGAARNHRPHLLEQALGIAPWAERILPPWVDGLFRAASQLLERTCGTRHVGAKERGLASREQRGLRTWRDRQRVL